MHNLINTPKNKQKLIDAGLKDQAVREKTSLFEKIDQTMAQMAHSGKTADVHAFWVPGRIEVLGKHTDYAGGRSLVAAADKGVCIAAVARNDRTIRVVDAAYDEDISFELSPELTPGSGWSNYPMTVARRVCRNFPGNLRGCDIVFASDLPPASGMSSSSALMIAIFFALAAANQLEKHDAYLSNINGPESLAGYLATIENGQNFGSLKGDKGVGTFGGSEDHTAILNCRANMLSQYSYCPVHFERFINMPPNCIFAIASSGVAAEKTGEAKEKYNRASLLASAVIQLWQQKTGLDDPHIAGALTNNENAADKMRTILRQSRHTSFTPAELLNRFEHFYAESTEIIPAAGDALLANNTELFGKHVDRSQAIAEKLLGNQVEETVFLAQAARKLGATAASNFGAGFGGSTWALIPDDSKTELFLQKWSQQYHNAFPDAAAKANFFTTQAGPSVLQLK
jgi:galactokinase